LFDQATQVTAGDSLWRGRTSDDYWAFVGPFGGATAATPHFSRCLIEWCGGLISTVLQPKAVIWA
jgi:hypothetical protein